MYETSKLKIVHWNCFKLTDSRLIEFEMFLKIFDPDIISIQEIKLNTNLANFKVRFNNYSTHLYTRDRGSDRGGGIAVLIKNQIAHSQITIPETNLEMIGLNLFISENTIKFFSYYNPPGKKISREFFEKYFDKKQNFILVGDLNSKTPIVGCKSSNPNGHILEKFWRIAI